MKKPNETRTAETDAKKTRLDYAASGFFVMRTPLLPFGEFLSWGNDLESASMDHDTEKLTQSLNRDRAVLRDRLRTLVTQPEIADAIFVASPDLYDYLEQWLADPESKRGQRVEGALVRYFSRMCSRATPFGLFASTSLGRIGEQTHLAVADKTSCERHTRLDMDYLFALADELGKDGELRQTLHYRPNSSLYTAAGKIRYVESRVDGRARTYHLVSVENSEYIEATLGRAATGQTIAELAAALVDDEITSDEAEQFISQLIDNQILVSELSVPVTGTEAIHPLIEQLRRSSANPEFVRALEQTRDELAAIDAEGLGAKPERYRAIAKQLESLPAKAELPRLFQVDMVRPAGEASLSQTVIDELQAGVEVLRSIFARPFESELRRFCQEFTNRYETREVALVEALDDDFGIGYPAGRAAGNAPLLQGLALPATSEVQSTWRARDAYLLQKLSDALMCGAMEIELEETDLKALSTKESLPLPDAFGVICRVAAESEEAVEQGEFQVLIESSGGPSGATWLGRFCHADAELHQEIINHLQAEESLKPEAIFAEIVHLPEGRIGNILARPVLRAYEIPYLGNSGAARERQLPVTDLMISVQGDRVVLRSARLGKEIIPRLTSAHNWPRESSTVFRFLCDLQAQGTMPGVMWNWGALESAPFLPKVVAGRAVLSRAQWVVSKKELQRICDSKDAERFNTIQQWRAERRLPRLVVLADGDNTLPIDLENVLSLDSFAHIVKDRDEVKLQELWPLPQQLLACAAESSATKPERYAHELIVPFIRRNDHQILQLVTPQARQHSHQLVAPVQRNFAPGSEWLYAKIYCGAATADQVIREVINPLATEVLARGTADQWFFIRYADPAWHLRVRFHGQPERLREEVGPALQALLSPMIKDGRVWRLQFDTYDREIERYGGAAGIELSEQFFFADSEAAAEIVERIDTSDAGLDERWRLTLCGMDRLLNDLGFDLTAKLGILKSARAGFLAEFNANDALHDQLGERYRRERKNLETLLDPTRSKESVLAPGLEVFDRRSMKLKAVAAQLRQAEQEGLFSLPLAVLAESYLHMTANRLLRSAQRAQEMVIYDLLTRLYSAQSARQQVKLAA